MTLNLTGVPDLADPLTPFPPPDEAPAFAADLPDKPPPGPAG